jgi:hypothetical protein
MADFTGIALTSLSVKDKVLSLVFSSFSNFSDPETFKVIASKAISKSNSVVWLDVVEPCSSAAVAVGNIPDFDFELGAEEKYMVRRPTIAVIPNAVNWPTTKLTIIQDGVETEQEVYDDVFVTVSANLTSRVGTREPADGGSGESGGAGSGGESDDDDEIMFIELPDVTKSALVDTYQTVELADDGIFRINNISPNSDGEILLEISYPMNEVAPKIEGSRVLIDCTVSTSSYADPVDKYLSPGKVDRDSSIKLPLDSAYELNEKGTFTRATKKLLAKYNELDPLFDPLPEPEPEPEPEL